MSPTFPKVYLARAGRDGEDETYALDNGVATIGFAEVPTLADAADSDAILNRPGFGRGSPICEIWEHDHDQEDWTPSIHALCS